MGIRVTALGFLCLACFCSGWGGNGQWGRGRGRGYGNLNGRSSSGFNGQQMPMQEYLPSQQQRFVPQNFQQVGQPIGQVGQNYQGRGVGLQQGQSQQGGLYGRGGSSFGQTAYNNQGDFRVLGNQGQIRQGGGYQGQTGQGGGYQGQIGQGGGYQGQTGQGGGYQGQTGQGGGYQGQIGQGGGYQGQTGQGGGYQGQIGQGGGYQGQTGQGGGYQGQIGQGGGYQGQIGQGGDYQVGVNAGNQQLANNVQDYNGPSITYGVQPGGLDASIPAASYNGPAISFGSGGLGNAQNAGLSPQPDSYQQLGQVNSGASNLGQGQYLSGSESTPQVYGGMSSFGAGRAVSAFDRVTGGQDEGYIRMHHRFGPIDMNKERGGLLPYGHTQEASAGTAGEQKRSFIVFPTSSKESIGLHEITDNGGRQDGGQARLATLGQSGNNFGQTDSSYGQAGSIAGQTGSGFGQAGSGFGQTGSGFGQAGSGFGQTGSTFGQTDSNYGQTGSGAGQTGSGFGQTGSGVGQTGSTFGHTGSGVRQTGSTFGQTGSSFGQTDNNYGQTGSGAGQTGSGFGQAGSGFGQTGSGAGQTGSGFGQTGSGFGQTGSGFGQTGSGFGQTGSGFGQTGSGFGQTGGNYGQTGNAITVQANLGNSGESLAGGEPGRGTVGIPVYPAGGIGANTGDDARLSIGSPDDGQQVEVVPGFTRPRPPPTTTPPSRNFQLFNPFTSATRGPRPDRGQSGRGQSGRGQSGRGQSGRGQSGQGQSGRGQSGRGQSGSGQSGRGQSGSGQSGRGQGSGTDDSQLVSVGLVPKTPDADGGRGTIFINGVERPPASGLAALVIGGDAEFKVESSAEGKQTITDAVVTCDRESNTITATVTLSKNFDGLVYAKGNFKVDQCRIRGNNGRQVTISLPLDGCGTTIKNGVDEYGGTVSYKNSIVVMNEAELGVIEEWDKAIALACDFAGAVEQTVRYGFGVPMLQLQEVTSEMGVPTCFMSVIEGESPIGTDASELRIGALATLVVTLMDSEHFDVSVFDCFAHDGMGMNRIQLIDENGCSANRKIIGQQEKRTDIIDDRTMAFARFKAFKFPDIENVYYECQCRICFDQCHPQTCGSRKKREAPESKMEERAAEERIFNGVVIVMPEEDVTYAEPEKTRDSSELSASSMCLNKTDFAIGTTFLGAILFGVGCAAIVLLYRRRL
ncbi:PREDICTED: hornerin-like isoform X2 [Priapulus caudatus]|uniref:Hornerin-like isoform X2 n=1 Tax=Priapulus caudatus TaxID=37621 RepID=A0ABM1F0E5_PRICU|nr:PREDICTED: hornerin-like isoform X2 [Priapulus caudatus]